MEAEGGCGVVGAACSEPIAGRHFLQALLQMKNRGNGKGGGIAALGLSPERLGVSRQVLQEDYLIQIAYLDPSARKAVEAEFISPFLNVDYEEWVETVADYKSIPGLEVKPPDVRRYFCRVKEDILGHFMQRTGLMDRQAAEDEFIYQNSYALNRKFYASLGEKQAFVLSHGKDMIVLKIVGWGDQVIRYYKLEDFEAHVWIGHHRYPTKGRVWHPGGAPLRRASRGLGAQRGLFELPLNRRILGPKESLPTLPHGHGGRRLLVRSLEEGVRLSD